MDRTSRGLGLMLAAAMLVPLGGCEGIKVEVGGRRVRIPGPPAPPPVEPGEGDPECGPCDHGLPERTSYVARSSVELKEGCYFGDFELGSSQIRVRGAGVGRTVIHGSLILQTQCEVSNLTVLGDVVFEGHQAELENVDFYGRVVDKGSQNRY